jgi:O-antigen/teichoic acid export membrane protein
VPIETGAGTATDLGLPRRVLLSTLSNYVAKGLTLSVWFFLTPYLVHRLGASDYGLWVLVGSVVSYGSLLDLGIAPAVTKYVAQYVEQKQFDHLRDLVSTAVWLYAGLGLLAILASAALAPIFPHLFALPVEQHAMGRWLVLLSGIGLGLALPAAITSAVLQGLHRFELANLISVIGLALFTATTIIAMALGWGLIGMVALNIPVTIITQLPALWLVHRAAPSLRLGLRRPRRQLIRTVFSFSSALVVTNLAGRVRTQTDEIVIGASLPLASVTPYAIARRLSGIPQILTYQFIKVLMPLASRLNAADERRQLQALYLTSARLTLALDVPLVCGLIVLGGAFLAIWVGPQYASAAPLLTVLAIAGLIDASMWPALSILQGMGRHRPIALFAVGSGVANLLLSIWLIRPLGVMGVALGTLIPTTIECFFFMMPYALRVNGISWREAWSAYLAPSTLPAVPMLITLYTLRALLHPSTYLAIGAVGLIGVGVYALFYLALTRGRPEQALLRDFLTRFLSTIRACGARPAEDEPVVPE